MKSFPSVLESIDDLNKEQVDGLLTLSHRIKYREGESHLFTHFRPIIATSFLENSTQTKHSFVIAIQKLGAMYIDFNAETLALRKDESLENSLENSLEDTFLTLNNQGMNLCIFRSSVSHLLSRFKEYPPIKIINAGDGTNEHPTQALLDLFTLLEICPDLKGKTLAILGDSIHSRVAHSLIKLLPLFGVGIILCGTSTFLPPKESLPKGVQLSTNRNETLKASDFIYLLRIQKESISDLNYLDYLNTYGVTLELLKKLQKLIPVFHPGPANIGAEIDQGLIKSSVYQRYLQVQNSIPMRMAIIQAILVNNDKNIGKINGEIF